MSVHVEITEFVAFASGIALPITLMAARSAIHLARIRSRVLQGDEVPERVDLSVTYAGSSKPQTFEIILDSTDEKAEATDRIQSLRRMTERPAH